MGQVVSGSLEIKKRITKSDVLFFLTLSSIVFYFWWKRGKKLLTLKNGPNTIKEFDQILRESQIQIERIELGFIQLQNKNQELDNLTKLKINEIKQIKQEIENTKSDYSELINKNGQKVLSIQTIKEKNDCLTQSLVTRELELSNAKSEIQKLQEELKNMRDSSSLSTEHIFSHFQHNHNGDSHSFRDSHDSEKTISLIEDDDEEDDDEEDDIYLWSTENPIKIFNESILFESGGACVGGIWLARDNRTNKQVVIKKILGEKDDRPRYVHDIARQEISITKHLQTHPNIVEFYDAFIIDKGKEYWLVMEYMDSKTLFDIVTNYNYMTNVFPKETELATISVEILKGLYFMHSKNVLHKDIKSENILFNSQMQIKLADFGNSTRVDETGQAEPQEAVGTCYWMAPEIIAEEVHDAKVDVWSFGVVLYEMLTGLPPYNEVKDSEEVKSLILRYNLPPPWKPDDSWTNNIRSFYNRCIILDPAKRASIEELLEHPFCTEKVAPMEKVYELMTTVTEMNDDEEPTEEEDDSF